jgi:hypothetical protein
VLENFEGRHRNLLATFEARADEMEDALSPHGFTKSSASWSAPISCNEYSFEASALFNPSIVAHPDQSGAAEGALRFILSLRAVGEGHVSSLTFRSGAIAADGSVTVDPTARLASSRAAGCRTGPATMVEVIFKPDEDISERVIFPSPNRSRTASKMRALSNSNDDGSKTYYATYTAYSGGRSARS